MKEMLELGHHKRTSNFQKILLRKYVSRVVAITNQQKIINAHINFDIVSKSIPTKINFGDLNFA